MYRDVRSVRRNNRREFFTAFFPFFRYLLPELERANIEIKHRRKK